MSSSATAFRSALGKGLGRAMLLLRQEPDSPVLQAELMQACKTNLIYDPTTENDRACYLHGLIQATGQERLYRQELERCLIEARSDKETFDTGQVLHLLCLLAADDDAAKRTLLHDFMRRATFRMTNPSAMQAFVQLEGAAALQSYVRRFADELVEEAWIVDGLIEALGERDGAEAVAAARAACPELDRLATLAADWASKEPDEKLDYPAAKEVLAAGGRLFPRAWTRNATPQELAQAARDLLVETDLRKLNAYLRLFWREAFPLPAASLFPLVRHEDAGIATTAARLLGRIEGSDARELALELLAGERLWNGIAILQASLRPGDFLRIEQRLENATLDADGWHEVGFAIFALFEDEETPPEASRRILLRLYEEEHCPFCRETVVRKLKASGGLPAWMAEECLFDAEPDTVSLVTGQLGEQTASSR